MIVTGAFVQTFIGFVAKVHQRPSVSRRILWLATRSSMPRDVFQRFYELFSFSQELGKFLLWTAESFQQQYQHISDTGSEAQVC